MTPGQEKMIDIRLKCLEIAAAGCSKNGLTKSEVIPIAEKFYEFVVKQPNEKGLGQDDTQSSPTSI